jgi:hypothetical protein
LRDTAVTLLAAALLFSACGDDSTASLDAFRFPEGDPDGGSVAGTITTDLADTTGGLMYVAAFSPDGGALLVGTALGEPTWPFHYQLDEVPGGPEVIRALLDLPPYSPRPMVDPPGVEDAVGVYLNASSILPVYVRPGLVTTRVDFFVTRMH